MTIRPRAARYFVGVDVQVMRPCPYVVLDERGEPLEAEWLPAAAASRVAAALVAIATRYGREVAVGIDAPRRPLPSPRRTYWSGGAWRPCRPSDRGRGRHCEIVIAAYGLANPQWTPHAPPFPAWMELGFAMFAALGSRCAVHEVFPSASYALLEDDSSLRIGLRLGRLAPGPKDMLDAYVAAATVREFAQGRGAAVGGGDGLGTIVLPRPLPGRCTAVLDWPDAPAAWTSPASKTGPYQPST